MTANGPMDPWYIYAVPWTPKQYIKILLKYKKNLFDPCQSMQTIEFFKTKERNLGLRILLTFVILIER